MKKILIAAGGSGGHVLPAQALAERLKKAGAEVLFVGHGLESNPFFDRSWPHVEIASAPLGLRAPAAYLRGLKQASKLIMQYRPHKVVGFGSWHALPAMVAAAMLRKKLFLYAPDLIPGKTLKLLSPVARTAIANIETARHLKGSSFLVDALLREVFEKPPTRIEAVHFLGLQPNRRTALVFGGSQGAKALNEVVPQQLAQLDVQVLHYTGTWKDVEPVEFFYKRRNVHAVVKPFEARMEMAWVAADFAVARAGAVTIAESSRMAVPTVFVPYPHAAEDHQRANAVAAQMMGLGLHLDEKNMSQLLDKIGQLPSKEQVAKAVQEWRCDRFDFVQEVLS